VIIFIGALLSFYAQFQSLIPAQDAKYVAAAFIIIGALKTFLSAVVTQIKSLPTPPSSNGTVSK
jgi:hypothetical protein